MQVQQDTTTTTPRITTTSTNNKQNEITSVKSPLHTFVLEQAYQKGRHSDVTIRAFDKDYHLHKLFLERNPFFASLISWPLDDDSEEDDSDIEVDEPESDYGDDIDAESDYGDDDQNNKIDKKEGKHSKKGDKKNKNKKDYHELCFDDPLITKQSFELCIKRLYFETDSIHEHEIPIQVMATANYMSMTEVINDIVLYLTSNMDMNNVKQSLEFCMNRVIDGELSEQLLDNCKRYMLRSGWGDGADAWVGIPVSVCVDIVGKDYFFVPTEYQRAKFIMALLENRIFKTEKTMDTDSLGSVVAELKSRDSRASDALSVVENTFSEIEPDADEDTEDPEPLRKVLNEEVIYTHLTMEQLYELKQYHDVNGNPYIYKDTIINTMFEAANIRNQILSSTEDKINYLYPFDDEPATPTSSATTTSTPATSTLTTSKIPDTSPAKQGKKYHYFKDSSSRYECFPIELDLANVCDNRKVLATRMPPLRTSVVFRNWSSLEEGLSLCSEVFFYAGAYWRVSVSRFHPEVAVFEAQFNSTGDFPIKESDILCYSEPDDQSSIKLTCYNELGEVVPDGDMNHWNGVKSDKSTQFGWGSVDQREQKMMFLTAYSDHFDEEGKIFVVGRCSSIGPKTGNKLVLAHVHSVKHNPKMLKVSFVLGVL
ncbi:unnamed protein product [Ambrosiozyma monospora]|uniref:Unnamed protein product n=1 Tax=Ambrosiozyma monospora TaxID=43982 RepID=A0A9W6YVS3_AMBMO|nr:unnamed protein product [Ambrosiozyma monospora]